MRIILLTFTEENHFTIRAELYLERKLLPLGLVSVQPTHHPTHNKHVKIFIMYHNLRYEFINVQIRRLPFPLRFRGSL